MSGLSPSGAATSSGVETFADGATNPMSQLLGPGAAVGAMGGMGAMGGLHGLAGPDMLAPGTGAANGSGSGNGCAAPIVRRWSRRATLHQRQR